MKKSKILSYILIFAVISAMFMPSSANALSDPAPSSKAVVLIDTATGNVLYAKNADEKVYPASTTKIMTVLLAVEAIEAGKVSLTDEVTAGNDINAGLSEDGSTAGIVPGETMTLESLLYCTMLSSANEACNIIADYRLANILELKNFVSEKGAEYGLPTMKVINSVLRSHTGLIRLYFDGVYQERKYGQNVDMETGEISG